MRNFNQRLQKLEQATVQEKTAYLWQGFGKSEAEVDAEIADLESKGFTKFIVASWLPQ